MILGFDRVKKRIEGYRQLVIQVQEELVAIPALGPENGGEGETQKAGLLKRYLEELNPARILEVNAPDKRVPSGSRPNLLAFFGPENLPETLWILSHLDVVPPGELSHWSHPPFQLKVEGDRLFGRGVEDNHHGIISSLLAVRALAEEGIPFKRRAALALVADEETGSRMGLDYVLKERRELFKERDWIVVPDFGIPEGTLIETAEKSMLWLKFRVKGRQCHASRPHLGKNTLTASAHLILALDKLKERFPGKNRIFHPPESTFECTRMEENVPNVNTIPGENVFYLDARVLPELPLEAVKEAILEITGKIQANLGVEVEVTPVQELKAPPPTSPHAPVVKALEKALREVLGLNGEAAGIGGGTVAAFFRRAGLPAVVWATSLETAHQPDECCLISQILADAMIFAHLLLQEHP
jgi:succinyl-diaminopimelate desuccinylase